MPDIKFLNKMMNEGLLLLDVLEIVPCKKIECYIQAPSLDDPVFQAMMSESNFIYYKLIRITSENKTAFIDMIIDTQATDYMQNVQLKCKGKLLFEGFDGVEFGSLSHTLTIPGWFKEKYIDKGLCNISMDW